MPSKAEIFDHLVNLLEELFEIDPASVNDSSLLYDDLDLDSIDAVDLMVRLKEYTGKKVDPQDFKNVRSVGDIVAVVEQLFDESAA